MLEPRWGYPGVHSAIAVPPALDVDLMGAVQAAMADWGRPPAPEDNFRSTVDGDLEVRAPAQRLNRDIS